MTDREAREQSLRLTAERLAFPCGKLASEVKDIMLEIERHTNKAAAAWEFQNDSRHNQKLFPAKEAEELAEGAKVAELAASIGLKTQWPGLYPSFTDRNGYSVSWIWGD
jgi:hypothetical protein